MSPEAWSSEAWGNLIGVVTVLSMATFIGIWIWAWGKRHRKVFKRMSELPMEDPPAGSAAPIPDTAPEDARPAAAARTAAGHTTHEDKHHD